MSDYSELKQCMTNVYNELVKKDGFCNVLNSLPKDFKTLAEIVTHVRTTPALMCQVYKDRANPEYTPLLDLARQCNNIVDELDQENDPAYTAAKREVELFIFNNCGHDIHEVGDFTNVPPRPTEAEVCGNLKPLDEL